ncbi:MAG: UPF0280 family protein [Spirochaetales bacterium]|nr:UPF0280 family protein [Spirochaetales bacterium]
MKREFGRFLYREAVYRINSEVFTTAAEFIPILWSELETHIAAHPGFRDSLVPLDAPACCNGIAAQMYLAARLCGVGPMAGVAGTFSEAIAGHCLKTMQAGSSRKHEVIVENGGDIFLVLEKPLVLGVFAGHAALDGTIGLCINPEDTPLAVCSSSGTMGHSLSFGKCDLATVFASDGALADCAATAAANMVQTEADIETAVNKICAVPGVRAVMIIKNGKTGLGGKVPELVRVDPDDVKMNLTVHPGHRGSIQ